MSGSEFVIFGSLITLFLAFVGSAWIIHRAKRRQHLNRNSLK